MKRFRGWIAGLTLLAVLGLPLNAAVPAAEDEAPATIVPIAEALATVTGIAISPLMGTAAYGAYRYYRTPEARRDRLPWFAQMAFWLPALGLVAAVALKDTLGAALPPGWKKPLDVLETIENKLSGVIAAGAVIPLTLGGLSHLFLPLGDSAAAGGSLYGALALTGPGLQAADVWQALTLPFSLAIFAVVWMASHALNVLILLSPWGVVDAALKLLRLGVLALITLAASLNPWVSLACSLLVILVSYLVAGWAFRLTTFGTIFSWDLLTARADRYEVPRQRAPVFSGGALKAVPPRTFGRLERRPDGRLAFRYRRLLILPVREVILPPPSQLWVGRGLFSSVIEGETGAIGLLTPRYRLHESSLASHYGLAGVRDAGLRRAWSYIRESLGLGAPVAAPSST